MSNEMSGLFEDLPGLPQGGRSSAVSGSSKGPFSDDAVLPSPTGGKGSDLLQKGLPMVRARAGCVPSAATCLVCPHAPLLDPTHPPPAAQRRDAAKDELVAQGAVEKALQKFTGGLQKVLEDIDRCDLARSRAWPGGTGTLRGWSAARAPTGPPRACRRLEALESRTEQACGSLAELQAVGALREDASRERLGGVEKTLREVHRLVQIIRDKQASARRHGRHGGIACLCRWVAGCRCGGSRAAVAEPLLPPRFPPGAG